MMPGNNLKRSIILPPTEKISCDSKLPGMDFTQNLVFAKYYFVAFNHGGCLIYYRPSSTFMKMFQKFIKTFYTLLLTALNLNPSSSCSPSELFTASSPSMHHHLEKQCIHSVFFIGPTSNH